MFSKVNARTSRHISVKDHAFRGFLRIVKPSDISQEPAMKILVESFIHEYKQYLDPSDIGPELDSWDGGEHSVEEYYKNYFRKELAKFEKGDIEFWVEAHLDGELVGWATFKKESSTPNQLYMDLLIVSPAHQRKGIGRALVTSLLDLGQVPNLEAINLLLRSKNKAGRSFYTALGFKKNPSYQGDENYVDRELLEPLTWLVPNAQHESRHESDPKQAAEQHVSP